jgi:5'-3' exonuclease
MVSETAYASIVGDSEKEERHRIYTPQEKIILLGKGTLKSKLELLRREGYNDRTVRGISKKYIKLLGEENVREHKAGA